MPVLEHKYPVVVNWTGGREGEGDITPGASGFTMPVNVPSEFGGPGGRTNPEELLTSAITGCYSITFGIVAANQKLPVVGVRVEAEGVVEQPTASSFKYKKITIRPTITLTAEATDAEVEKAESMAHKCDAYCIVTNAVRASVEVVVEPTVVRA